MHFKLSSDFLIIKYKRIAIRPEIIFPHSGFIAHVVTMTRIDNENKHCKCVCVWVRVCSRGEIADGIRIVMVVGREL